MDKKNAVLIFSSETFAKQRAIFLSVRKRVNSQGYSELREPIKMLSTDLVNTNNNYYSILNARICFSLDGNSLRGQKNVCNHFW